MHPNFYLDGKNFCLTRRCVRLTRLAKTAKPLPVLHSSNMLHFYTALNNRERHHFFLYNIGTLHFQAAQASGSSQALYLRQALQTENRGNLRIRHPAEMGSA
jgi:hypothetical protein